MEIELSKIDEIIDKHSLEHRWLIGNLLAIQDEFQYLPQEAMRHVAERMNVPLIQVNQVAEFYKVFKLKPPGKHLVSVCRGTACHVRGGEKLVERIGDLLDVVPGDTTGDEQFTLDGVNCLGCCALGRAVVVDDHFYVDVTPDEVEGILDKYAGNGG
jgi:NADH-quinone oxidoreductase subunit E